MNSEVEPHQKKKKTTKNPSPSFLSLPDDIIVNCLSRISRSYYPKLSLVCKTFCSLVSSKALSRARYHLGTSEEYVHVCLQFCNRKRPSWYSLWIKPDQTLTNDLGKNNNSTRNTRLVPIPSSCYSPRIPSLTVMVGSECYKFSQKKTPSSVMWFCKEGASLWRNANMTVSRVSPVAGSVNEKLYVMGGCGENECANWAESFDPKTQTWEPLPDPGVNLRFSDIKKIQVINGKLCVKSNTEKNHIYDPKEGKWNLEKKSSVKAVKIGNVGNIYVLGNKGCLFYLTKRKEWRKVRGLGTLDMNLRDSMIEIVKYGGKLLILWNKFPHYGQNNHNIWCAVIGLERRNNDEVWGNIEWANVVFSSTCSFDFMRTQVSQY